MSLRRLFLILPLALLAACTQSVSADKLATAKTIGVVSTIGDTFEYQRSGVFNSGDESSTADIRSWNLDQVMVEQAASLLQPRFKAVPWTAAAPKNISHNKGEVGRTFRSALGPTAPQVDLWLVFSKWKTPDFLWRQYNFTLDGVGMRSQTTLNNPMLLIYTMALVTLIDGRTMQVIAEEELTYEKFDFERLAKGYPYMRLDRGLNAQRWFDVDDTWRARIRDSMIGMLRVSVTNTLNEMKLSANAR